MTTLPRSLRDLGHSARQASDSQIMKLVRMVDGLPTRGAADAILEPVRARLKHLRPERPLNLSRLLFLPLDAVLVNARDWRPGPGQVPRTAIAPLVSALRVTEARVFERVEGVLAGFSFSNGQMVSELGTVLWAAAARSLPGLPPAGWTEAGLPLHAFPIIVDICRPLWRHGSALWKLRLAAVDGLREQELRIAFRQVAQDGPEAVATALSALLPYVLNPAETIATVGGLDRSLAVVAEQVLDKYLAGVDAGLSHQDLSAMASAAIRFARVLEDLDKAASPEKPKRAQLLHGLRQTAADACAARVKGRLYPDLMQPLSEAIAAEAVTDADLDALEKSAAALRSIASSGRGLRRDGGFDQALAPAVALLEGALVTVKTAPTRFCVVDALRILEIISGSTIAGEYLRLVTGEPRSGGGDTTSNWQSTAPGREHNQRESS